MPIRDWSGSRLVLIWIWSSLAIGITEPVAVAVGHPLPSGISSILRLVLLIALVILTWKWYRQRTVVPANKGDSLT